MDGYDSSYFDSRIKYYSLRDRTETRAPSYWCQPTDYPVFQITLDALQSGSLRQAWFRWLAYSDRKKNAIRYFTRKDIKKHFGG
jgi:hypothetical protein